MTEPAAPSSPVEIGPLLRVRGGKAYYQAKTRADGRPVLVMRMGAAFRSDPAAEKRVRREFAAAHKVGSPYVMRYLALLEDPAHGPALVMEPEKGTPLRAHLAVHGKLGYEQAHALMIQVSAGLLACHRAGVVHRDVSPDTVRLDKGGVQLTDFGLSYFQQATALTLTGTMLQAPEYAPPETFVGTSHDLRCDVYSAGIVFWEALVGRSPFEGQPLAELLESKKAPVPPPSAVEPACPDWLDRLLAAMTAPDPEARPVSFAEILEALNNRDFAPPVMAPAKGRCMHCGHAMVPRAAFCVACGEERAGGTRAGDVTLLVTNVSDVEGAAALLESTFPGKPLAPLRKTLRNRRVFLGTNFSPTEADWLLGRLRAVGVAASVQPTYKAFDKLAWFFAGAILLIALLVAITLETSWALNIPANLAHMPEVYSPFINRMNLALAIAILALFATLGKYRLTLSQLAAHGWRSVRDTVKHGPKLLGLPLLGAGALLARAALVLVFVWLAPGAIVQLCYVMALASRGSMPLNTALPVLPVVQLTILWILAGKAAEPILYDRRDAAARPMLPAAEFALWRALQEALRAARLPAFGQVAASGALAFATGEETSPAGYAGDECRALLREGLLAVIRQGEAIHALQKKGLAGHDPLIHERLNEARRASGLMRTALLRLQRLAADPKIGEETARSLAELRLEMKAMAGAGQ